MDENAEREEAERQVLCSRCLEVFAESQIHVIPWFNETAERYITTYRCEQCWLPSLAETRTRLSVMQDEAEIADAAEFFKRNGYFIHEYLRGDPMDVVRRILVHMLGMMERGDIRLSIGPSAPSA
ncbi:MAG TPA: hypothetical protein VNV38_03995 [Stellaceae bacterium]|jgi:hypothetical protein|nr:hypothetical protein [Stellaceae bacterium]